MVDSDDGSKKGATFLDDPRWTATHLLHECGSCKAKYRYPRAQVEGRVVEKKCMSCSTTMRVDGTKP